MAKDRSKSTTGATKLPPPPPPNQQNPPPNNGAENNSDDFPEAFEDGKNFQATGDVDHYSRTVSRSLQQKWDQFAANYNTGVTASEQQSLMKDWDSYTNSLYGYFRTTNSFAINQALYDPKNAGKTDAQIFTRRDRHGAYRDLQTVQTLDKVINSHTTAADASYTRFCSPNALQSTFGLSSAQISMLSGAASMNAQQLATLNKAIAGSTSFSKAYTSTSANRSMNAFGNPRASQSRNFIFERKINVPKGTNAYAPRQNAQESEVLFGRGMQTKITGISVSNDGHIVIHEKFVKYN